MSAAAAMGLPERGLKTAAGVGLCALVSLAAAWIGAVPVLAHAGIGVLTLAIALGIVAGNLVPGPVHGYAAPGVALCQRGFLRAGVALYGLRLTLQQIVLVGPAGIVTDLLMMSGVLALGFWAGTRLLKLDRETALLVSTGSAICGAAAVMAAEPVVRAPPHKVAIAVATVTIFGTLAIVLYPILFHYMGLDPAHFGIYVGSTVHEVAQVVAVGKAVSPVTADRAVIVKLIRVALLAPFLLMLARLRETDAAHKASVRVPGFVWLFLLAAAVNSAGLLPAPLHAVLLQLDAVLLALAMAALGWSTQARMLKAAGLRPLLLGGLLFVFLVCGGYVVNRVVTAVLGGLTL
jgi:uncharacterized integral membrane protein (TIGR00698 family)